MFEIKPISSKEISKILKAQPINEDVTVRYISTDTREAFLSNTCFIALKGNNYDGNDFICEAIKKKCALIITDKKFPLSVPSIVVKDTLVAFGLIAKHLSPRSRVIGITGSVGKTTVKEMLTLILKEKYTATATVKNENNEIGVAKTLLSQKDNDYCVVEMGMRGMGEIEYLSYLAEPYISIITNCGTSHLELLGSEENIFKAKLEILKNTKKYIIVPYEKRFFFNDYAEIEAIFVGDDIKYFDLDYFENGIRFSVKYNNSIIRDIKLRTFNVNNVNNALFAIAAGMLCGVPNEQIKLGLEKYKGENMHEEITKIKGITVIKDCYNASYESVKGAIFSLIKYAEIKKVTPNLLLGDMLEIGEASQEYHYRIGELCKDLGVKNLFATGKYAKNTIDGFSGGFACDKKEKLAQLIMSKLNENDVILVKASRALMLEKVVEYMKEIENE